MFDETDFIKNNLDCEKEFKFLFFSSSPPSPLSRFLSH